MGDIYPRMYGSVGKEESMLSIFKLPIYNMPLHGPFLCPSDSFLRMALSDKPSVATAATSSAVQHLII